MGTRIVYVLLEGSVCDLFVVVSYIPYKGRKKAPYVKDIIAKLRELLTTFDKTIYIVLMRDLS